MPLIIDANRAHVVGDASSLLGGAIRRSVTKRSIVIATGGKNLRELGRSAIASYIRELSRAGLLKQFREIDCHDEECRVLTLSIKSDDAHIIALARLSKAFAVLTDDRLLSEDLRNAALVGFRRRVISNDQHRSILHRCR